MPRFLLINLNLIGSLGQLINAESAQNHLRDGEGDDGQGDLDLARFDCGVQFAEGIGGARDAGGQTGKHAVYAGFWKMIQSKIQGSFVVTYLHFQFNIEFTLTNVLT